MKSIIFSIGLISTINASKRLLSQTCDGAFEEYTLCGSACPDVCGVDPPDACIQVCVEGCFCAKGYIRDTNGRCILESECTATTAQPTLPPGCAALTCAIGNTCCDDGRGGVTCCPICDANANEVFSSCNGHCRPTCANPPPIACSRICQPGCNCADGYILDEDDGTCIPDDQCPATTTAATRDVCPLRCEGGYDGCNTCGCDGLGNPTFCTLRFCGPGEITPAECRSCEIGYTLNKDTNTCDSAKVSCNNNGDCDKGFKCRKDPECREYSDLRCGDTGKVCVTRRGLETPCNSESDCETENGFGCLLGDMGPGRCVKYQSP